MGLLKRAFANVSFARALTVALSIVISEVVGGLQVCLQVPCSNLPKTIPHRL
jgi:hypothetical protein